MVDDDCILDVKWGLSDKFAKDPINVLERLPKYVTTVFPINPIFIRIAWTLQDPQYQSNWVFERDFTLTNKLVFHRNIKPFYQNTSLTALEDYDWGFQQCKSNYLCVRLNNIVLKEITAKSSYFNNKEERKQKYNESKNKLIELYPELFMNNKGHFMKRKLIEKYCNYEKIIQLPI